MNHITYLKKLNACPEAIEWAKINNHERIPIH